jgi:catechol 1,2-dioxygenase
LPDPWCHHRCLASKLGRLLWRPEAGRTARTKFRGLFTADGDGNFWFRTIVPSFYPIPDDGPVGDLLKACGRHPNRPAHVHFIVQAPGYRAVTTHLFVDGSPHLDSDVVVGVKESLVRSFALVDDPERASAVRLDNPFREVRFDAILSREPTTDRESRTP